MKKMILTESEKKRILKLYNIKEDVQMDLPEFEIETTSQSSDLGWLQSAEYILSLDEFKNYSDYKNDMKWPYPAINISGIENLNDRFGDVTKGICYKNFPKCYKNVLVYSFKGDGSLWLYKQNDDKKEFENKEKLLPSVTITGTMNIDEKVDIITKSLKESGVEDIRVAASIIGVVSKESGFILGSEQIHTDSRSYKLKEWFPVLNKYSDDEIKNLQKDEEQFYNLVYGLDGVGEGLGNVNIGDGYKYRGRGWNGITGRLLYRLCGYENNPEALETVEGATIALVNYYKNVTGTLDTKYEPTTPLSTITMDFIKSTAGSTSNSPFIMENYNKAWNYIKTNLLKGNILTVPNYGSKEVTL
jgi:predicted chitinase